MESHHSVTCPCPPLCSKPRPLLVRNPFCLWGRKARPSPTASWTSLPPSSSLFNQLPLAWPARCSPRGGAGSHLRDFAHAGSWPSRPSLLLTLQLVIPSQPSDLSFFLGKGLLHLSGRPDALPFPNNNGPQTGIYTDWTQTGDQGRDLVTTSPGRYRQESHQGPGCVLMRAEPSWAPGSEAQATC